MQMEMEMQMQMRELAMILDDDTDDTDMNDEIPPPEENPGPSGIRFVPRRNQHTCTVEIVEEPEELEEIE